MIMHQMGLTGDDANADDDGDTSYNADNWQSMRFDVTNMGSALDASADIDKDNEKEDNDDTKQIKKDKNTKKDTPKKSNQKSQ